MINILMINICLNVFLICSQYLLYILLRKSVKSQDFENQKYKRRKNAYSKMQRKYSLAKCFELLFTIKINNL